MQHKVPRQLTFRLKILRASQGNIHFLPPLFSLTRSSLRSSKEGGAELASRVRARLQAILHPGVVAILHPGVV